MKIKSYIIALLIAFGLVACKRQEPTSWDVDVVLPVAKGRLQLNDLVTDSLLSVDANGVYHLHFSENLTDFSLDTLVQVPDTTIHKKFEVPLNGGPFTIPANVTLIDQNEDRILEVGNVLLREMVAGSGYMRYSLKSYINGYLDCSYSIPGLSYNGIPTVILAQTSPSTGGVPNVVTGVIDLTNYTFDLSGVSGGDFNKMNTNLLIRTSPTAPASAIISAHDSVVVDLEFVEATVAYARGYFGSEAYELNENVEFGSGLNLPEGSLNLESAAMSLKVQNYVGVDAALQFHSLGGWNAATPQNIVNLDYAPIMQTMNLERAELSFGEVVPTERTFNMNEGNSNLTSFLGNLPTSMALDATVLLNPLGDVSQANDFIFTNRTLEATLDLDVPLKLSTAGIVLRDTFALDTKQLDQVHFGKLKLKVENTFPVNATVLMHLADSETSDVFEVETTGSIVSGSGVFTPGPLIPVWSEVDVVLNASDIERLKNSAKLIVELRLDTPLYPAIVAVTPEMYLDFYLSVSGQGEVSYE
jgi:hypothetical protein